MSGDLSGLEDSWLWMVCRSCRPAVYVDLGKRRRLSPASNAFKRLWQA